MSAMQRLLVFALLAWAGAVVAASTPDINLRVVMIRPEDALLQVFKQSGDNFIIALQGTGDRRISLNLQKAPLEVALKRICDEAELNLTRTESVFVVTGSAGSGQRLRGHLGTHLGTLDTSNRPNPSAMTFNPLAMGMLAHPSMARNTLSAFGTNGSVYRFEREERSTFTCPHCKRTITVLGQKDQCVQCSRGFQRDWAFCPFDGATRATPLSDWKVCPFCTKGVKSHADAADSNRNG